MSKKAMVLLSGGVDSSTCLALAIKKFGRDNVGAITITYGQKHSKEVERAKKIASYYQIKHEVLDISNVFRGSNSALLTHSTDNIKTTSYAEQCKESKTGMVNTFVPFRNGVFLAILAAKAMDKCGDDDTCSIYIGNHADDAAGNAYADCSVDFIKSISQAIALGTYNKVEVVSPFKQCTKKDIVKKGLELGVPYELTWSCYQGAEKPCHVCGTCRDREQAFIANGVEDPLVVLEKEKK